jgi:hypothetical protein
MGFCKSWWLRDRNVSSLGKPGVEWWNSSLTCVIDPPIRRRCRQASIPPVIAGLAVSSSEDRHVSDSDEVLH